MRLPNQTQQATLIQRYKRFLTDVRLDDGTTLTVHCPNSGSMLGCSTPGMRVLISLSSNPKRKYPWTLEQVQVDATWVGVNTSLTNKIVHEGLENGSIDDFHPILSIRPEIKISDKSRLDFMLEHEQGNQATYLEVKNCSLAQNGTALFPDAVTQRGTKHLEELIQLADKGYGACILFCIQRKDADCFTPAKKIDPLYAHTLQKAQKSGVTILAYRARVTQQEITIEQKVPVYLP